ncbi:MAG: hypothetical protein LH606_09785 [Cytophagaceae bacterium]|nr:hypothetical protein [Cytophagaceae bacterium]
MKTFICRRLLLLFVVMSGLSATLQAQVKKPGALFRKLPLAENLFAEKVNKLRQYAYASEFSFIEFNDFLPTLRKNQLSLILPNRKDTLLVTQNFVQVKTPREYAWSGEILDRKDEGILGEVSLYYNHGE